MCCITYITYHIISCISCLNIYIYTYACGYICVFIHCIAILPVESSANDSIVMNFRFGKPFQLKFRVVNRETHVLSIQIPVIVLQASRSTTTT